MKLFILIAVLFFVSEASFSQTEKGVWLLGGNAKFANLKYDGDGGFAQTNIDVAGNVGYFFIDNLTGGIRIEGHIITGKVDNSRSTTTTFLAGPFARCYFLPATNRLNFFLDGSFQPGLRVSNSNDGQYLSENRFSYSYAFLAGPVIYFNTSVALELGIGYQSIKFSEPTLRQSTIQASIGFQFHLQREEDY